MEPFGIKEVKAREVLDCRGEPTRARARPVITRAYSFKHPVELKKNMVLAIETYAGKEGGREGVRLEENVVITDTGFELISLYPHDDRLIDL